MSHDYHGDKVGIVFYDGCQECEHRAAEPERMFGWMDDENFMLIRDLAKHGPMEHQHPSQGDLAAARFLNLAGLLAARAMRMRVVL